jgi:pimeloyl-ACP methyl ester carboxylesterase
LPRSDTFDNINDVKSRMTVRRRNQFFALRVICVTAATVLFAAVSPARGNATLPVGSLTLRACGHAAYCGRIDRPLDPTGAVAGTVPIYFEFYPHTGPGPAAGVLVATEGGPGYPATESRDEYLALFKPLMTDRDVIIMDNRGTGHSGAIDCHALQSAPAWTVAGVAECGNSLGDRASLYSTAYAADDLAALLKDLGFGKIDLYGDSYGTYFEQVFATRHPDALRSIVLDGAYPLTGADYAWYPTYAPAMRAKFNTACARSAACAALPGDSIEHILPTLRQLRAAPFAAVGYDIDGRERHFRADASQLAIVMYGSAPALTTARETDAAARAFARGDHAPLLRLMAETASAVDSRDPSADPAQWSAGLAAAVMCQDPPQIFDMRLAPAARMLERDRAVARRQRDFPDTYAPFSIDEYRAMPLDYSFLDECVGWPVSPPTNPASQVGTNAIYPDVPALIISGELDNITTPADGAAVAAAFKHGLQIRIANGFHVNALPHSRSVCAADIARRFLATADAGDTSCAARVPPLRLVPNFARLTHELAPAAGLRGNSATSEQLRVVTAALMTVGDLLARVSVNSTGTGVGLRGGSFAISQRSDRSRVMLTGVRWVDDLGVSGTIDGPKRDGPERGGLVKATLHLTGIPFACGTLHIHWFEGVQHARALIDGTLGHARVVAASPAP